MKYLIASDIHGSAYFTGKLMEVVENETPDRIILLGDVLYHGPRNALPKDYNPAKVAEMLNEKADMIVAVRGNCDAEVDQMVLGFPCLADFALVEADGLTLYCTHGHLSAPNSLPALKKGTVFLSGHTHVKIDEDHNGIRCINPGSVSIPKDGSNSCMILENGTFRVVNLGE